MRPLLHDELVSLRPWELADAPLVCLASRDAYVAGMAGIRRQCGLRSATRWVVARQQVGEFQCSLALVDRLTCQAAGEVGVVADSRYYVGYLYYWILASERGRGLATAGARLLCDWAQSQGPLTLITAFASDRNLASRKVLQHLGFHRGRACGDYAGYPGVRDTFGYFRFPPR